MYISLCWHELNWQSDDQAWLVKYCGCPCGFYVTLSSCDCSACRECNCPAADSCRTGNNGSRDGGSPSVSCVKLQWPTTTATTSCFCSVPCNSFLLHLLLLLPLQLKLVFPAGPLHIVCLTSADNHYSTTIFPLTICLYVRVSTWLLVYVCYCSVPPAVSRLRALMNLEPDNRYTYKYTQIFMPNVRHEVMEMVERAFQFVVLW